MTHNTSVGIRRRFASRLEKLEATIGAPALFFRYGWLTTLPKDFAGERHIVIVKREPAGAPNVEWCKFEERPGSGSTEDRDEGLTVYLTR